MRGGGGHFDADGLIGFVVGEVDVEGVGLAIVGEFDCWHRVRVDYTLESNSRVELYRWLLARDFW